MAPLFIIPSLFIMSGCSFDIRMQYLSFIIALSGMALHDLIILASVAETLAGLAAMLSVFKAEEWDNNGLLVTDSALIYSVVDVLLGGRKGTPAIRVEGRPYTTIETKLVERMVGVALSDLSSAFDPLSPVSFSLDRMETNPRFATITQSGNACVLARLRVDMGDRGGRIEILIPYATLEPIRELLLQMFTGEKFGRDSIWENHLTLELYKT